MPVTNYYSVKGRILSEATVGGSGVRAYGSDALGSVVATYDTNGLKENVYHYKPYGAQVSKTGTAADPKFTWVGSLGYRQTGLSFANVYVRARHYATVLGRWTAVDLLWPYTRPYPYARSSPLTSVDPTGLLFSVDHDSCAPCLDYYTNAFNDITNTLNRYCARWNSGGMGACVQNCANRYNRCIDLHCMHQVCTAGAQTVKITCTSNPNSLDGCGGSQPLPCGPGCLRDSYLSGNDCATTTGRSSPPCRPRGPGDSITICCPSYGGDQLVAKCRCTQTGGWVFSNCDSPDVIFHELVHWCGTDCPLNPGGGCDNVDDTQQQQDLNNAFAACISGCVGLR